jgi:hypothetical protein
MKRVGRNVLCWCKSGKKYKRCHLLLEQGVGAIEVELSGGKVLLSDIQISASFTTETPSTMPQWLLSIAISRARYALTPDGGDLGCLDAILYVCTAAEALVNRLLEPLVPEGDWLPKKNEKGKLTDRGIEGLTAEKKWKKLYSLLNIKPELSEGTDPFRSFLAVVEIRNQLIHFKHGKNIERTETPLKTTYRYGHVEADGTRPLGPRLVIQKSEIREFLGPGRARGYMESLKGMLEPVLKVYPEDRFGVVGILRSTLMEWPSVST